MRSGLFASSAGSPPPATDIPGQSGELSMWLWRIQTNGSCAAESAAVASGSPLGGTAKYSGASSCFFNLLSRGEAGAEQSNAGWASAGRAGPQPSDAGRGRKAGVGVVLFAGGSQAPAEPQAALLSLPAALTSR